MSEQDRADLKEAITRLAGFHDAAVPHDTTPTCCESQKFIERVRERLDSDDAFHQANADRLGIPRPRDWSDD